jgi:hypothetical protein
MLATPLRWFLLWRAVKLRCAPGRGRRSRRGRSSERRVRPMRKRLAVTLLHCEPREMGRRENHSSASHFFCSVLSWMMRMGSTPGRSGAMRATSARASTPICSISSVTASAPVARRAQLRHRPSGPRWFRRRQSLPGMLLQDPLRARDSPWCAPPWQSCGPTGRRRGWQSGRRADNGTLVFKSIGDALTLAAPDPVQFLVLTRELP